MKLASLLVDRGKDKRELTVVHVFTGQPVPSKDSTGYAASRRQHAAWAKLGAHVHARPLRYPFGYPDNTNGKLPTEKGIDVTLALKFISDAVDDVYDCGILVSSDTDLKPALEFVIDRYPQKKAGRDCVLVLQNGKQGAKPQTSIPIYLVPSVETSGLRCHSRSDGLYTIDELFCLD